VTAGQVSVYIGARALLSSLPNVDWLLRDRGYDAEWFLEVLKDKGIRACIPGRKQRKKTVKYDKGRYKRRNRIEIMFGRLKDWWRVATRYDRCPKVFLSAIALAAIVIYGLCVIILRGVAATRSWTREAVTGGSCVTGCLFGTLSSQRQLGNSLAWTRSSDGNRPNSA
jgi:transposase